jgi:disulfide oxidoreductase YuzD
MKLIEIFSAESFSYKEIMEGIEQEKYQIPVVIIDGKIFQSGGKLSEKLIRERMEHVYWTGTHG